MNGLPRRTPLRLFFAIFGIGALVPACGDDCPDVSGVWSQTLVCGGSGVGHDEEWEQNDCDVVRRSLAGEKLGSATLEEDGGITVTSALTAAPCRGSVSSNRVEVSCPNAVGQTCDTDTCCTARWERFE